MGSRRRTELEMSELIRSYDKSGTGLTKSEFCKQANISVSCFYRHLARYQSINESKAKMPRTRAAKFIELKPQPLVQEAKPGCVVVFRLLGLKLFKLELEYV